MTPGGQPEEGESVDSVSGLLLRAMIDTTSDWSFGCLPSLCLYLFRPSPGLPSEIVSLVPPQNFQVEREQATTREDRVRQPKRRQSRTMGGMGEVYNNNVHVPLTEQVLDCELGRCEDFRLVWLQLDGDWFGGGGGGGRGTTLAESRGGWSSGSHGRGRRRGMWRWCK